MFGAEDELGANPTTSKEESSGRSDEAPAAPMRNPAQAWARMLTMIGVLGMRPSSRYHWKSSRGWTLDLLFAPMPTEPPPR